MTFLSNNPKVRGSYGHYFGYKYKETYFNQSFKIKKSISKELKEVR